MIRCEHLAKPYAASMVPLWCLSGASLVPPPALNQTRFAGLVDWEVLSNCQRGYSAQKLDTNKYLGQGSQACSWFLVPNLIKVQAQTFLLAHGLTSRKEMPSSAS